MASQAQNPENQPSSTLEEIRAARLEKVAGSVEIYRSRSTITRAVR